MIAPRARRPASTAMAAIAALVSLLGASQASPHRIVSFIPAVTQMLFAIGAGPQVVAVGTFDHEPPQVEKLPKVGGLLDPDVERILALKPDLVVVYQGQKELIERLTHAHIPMFPYKHGNLADVTATMRALGQAVGRSEDASAAADRIEAALRAVAGRVAGLPRPSTMLVFGREPHSLRNIFASGGYGFLHDLIELAGGRDVFADIPRESVQPSIEQILARRPEVIIELRYGASAGEREDMSAWQTLASIPAVRNGRLYELVGDVYVEAGPRVATAAEGLANLLHPK